MTFSMVAAGTKEQVHEQLDAAVEQHVRWNNPREELQKVVDVAKHWLDTGSYPGGAYVEASGHLDKYAGSLTLTVKPLNMNIPERKPEPDAGE